MGMSSHEELRSIALSEFARAGYGSTSLQQIAELAGLSKSSVLYHFSSKEALLDAAISPAVEQMDAIVAGLEGRSLSQETRSAFVVEFVDFLLEHRSEVHMFINQARALEDVPVVERANGVVVRMATYFRTALDTAEHRLRFGIALGGAAYVLATQETLGEALAPLDETRAALVTILNELINHAPLDQESI